MLDPNPEIGSIATHRVMLGSDAIPADKEPENHYEKVIAMMGYSLSGLRGSILAILSWVCQSLLRLTERSAAYLSNCVFICFQSLQVI